MTNHRAQQIWIWGGVVSIVLFIVGWVGLMGFLPPLSPSASADDIAAKFAEDADALKVGTLFMIFGCTMWVPWSAVVAGQLRRAERDYPVLAWTQVGAAAAAAAIVDVGLLCWEVAAYRPLRDPELTLMLSDMGFIMVISPFFPFFIWTVALGLAIFVDKRPVPAFPRWSAYFCLWMAFLYVPGGALYFFTDGPFAWNGALAFFLPATAFFIWICVMTWLTIQSIARQHAAATQADARREHDVRPLQRAVVATPAAADAG